MSSISVALDALDAAVATINALDVDRCDPVTRLRALERLETARRRQVVASHDLIAGLADEDPADVGGPVHKVIADWLRITCAEARRRMRDAEQLSPRVTLTGEVLPPELPATAQAWRSGLLDPQHLKVIQTFARDLPVDTPVDTVERAECFLAQQAAKLRPDQLDKVANKCAVLINPDGKFSDTDRARRRGFTWSPQRPDGMSVGKLIASPELRANSMPGSPGSRHRACVTLTMKAFAAQVSPTTTWRARICVAMRKDNTTRSMRWFPANWATRH